MIVHIHSPQKENICRYKSADFEKGWRDLSPQNSFWNEKDRRLKDTHLLRLIQLGWSNWINTIQIRWSRCRLGSCSSHHISIINYQKQINELTVIRIKESKNRKWAITRTISIVTDHDKLSSITYRVSVSNHFNSFWWTLNLLKCFHLGKAIFICTLEQLTAIFVFCSHVNLYPNQF
jgi:hypothetical protein